jgi:hypothetical protein
MQALFFAKNTLTPVEADCGLAGDREDTQV